MVIGNLTQPEESAIQGEGTEMGVGVAWLWGTYPDACSPSPQAVASRESWERAPGHNDPEEEREWTKML